MKTNFIVTLDVDVQSHDVDVMLKLPDAIRNRFEGTAIHINSIDVNKKEVQ